jgi:hypothetical protein
MLKLLSLISLLFLTLFCFAGEQIIAGKNSPEYKIVLPDKSIAEKFLLRTAKLMQEVIYKSTGSKLKIIHEKDAGGLTHGIYIGETRKTIKAGINPDKFDYWEYQIKSDGSNVYIAGREKSKGNWKLKHYRYYELGSCKGVVDFLNKYIGFEVLQSDCDQYNGREGVTPASDINVFEKKKAIKIPSNLNLKVKFQFKYCIGRELSLFYRLANNMFLAPWMHSYGGHSHDKAIPKKLFKTHPEYFAEINGKRKLLKRPMYCLSNKNVQELIYQEMVKRLKNVDWVQLAQTDGFNPCQCKNCKEMYNTDKWSEKLWILHRNLAKRLFKEMPDKKVVILSYADTKHPPKTFKSFPPNTIIELCENDKKTLDEWKKINVPGGLAEYVYNWGYYHTAGFTPKTGIKDVVDQIKLFSKYNVKGIYTCGFGELWGLEGPVYYAYGQALKDPENADPEKILAKYCRLAFGPAAKEAENFYKYLYARPQIELPETKYDYNKIDFRMPYGYDNYFLLDKRYSATVIAKLNSLLSAIKNKVSRTEGDNRYKRLTEQLSLELKYLDITAALARSFVKYLDSPNRVNLAELNNKILRRDKWLSRLPQKNDAVGKHKFKFYTTSHGLKFLGGYKSDLIRENGNWCGRFYYPLVWNISQLLERKVYPGGRVIQATRNDGTSTFYQQLIPYNFYFKNYKNPTDVKVNYDNKCLKVSFLCRKGNARKFRQKTFYLKLKTPKMKLERSFEFKPSDKKARVYKARPGNPYNGISYDLLSGANKTTVQVINTQNPEDAEIVLKIPFDILGGIPKPNDCWSIGFVCIGQKAGEPNLVWEPDIKYLNGTKTRYLGRGKLIFK